MDSESVPESTREEVLERDGDECWLCHDDLNIHIAHHIDAAAQYAFSQFRANGTISSETTSVSHPDNLFPLCANCHGGYDKTFPDWLLIPDGDTLQKYIDHEKKDYQERYLISQSSPSSVPPRSLPIINRNEVLYHPLVMNPGKKNKYFGEPRQWQGDPAVVILRAAYRGLFNSTPVQPRIRLGPGATAREWQTGVPDLFRLLVGQLMSFYGRQPLGKIRKRSGL